MGQPCALRAIRTIRSGVKMLAHQPETGRPVVDRDPAFREKLIGFGSSGYNVLYHFDGSIVTILAVRHQKEVGF